MVRPGASKRKHPSHAGEDAPEQDLLVVMVLPVDPRAPKFRGAFRVTKRLILKRRAG